MKTYEFVLHSKGDGFFRLKEDIHISFCKNELPLQIPSSAKRVWVQLRTTPAKGFLEAEFVPGSCFSGNFCRFVFEGKRILMLPRISSYILREGWVGKPFYFCMYYE